MKRFQEFIKESEENIFKDLEYIEDVFVKLEDYGVKSTIEEGLFNTITKEQFFKTSENLDGHKSAKEWIESVLSRKGDSYGYEVAYRINIKYSFNFKEYDIYYAQKLKILEETLSLLSKTYKLYNFNQIKTDDEHIGQCECLLTVLKI